MFVVARGVLLVARGEFLVACGSSWCGIGCCGEFLVTHAHLWLHY